MASLWGNIIGKITGTTVPPPLQEQISRGTDSRPIRRLQSFLFQEQRLPESGLALELFWILSSDPTSDARLVIVGDNNGRYHYLPGFEPAQSKGLPGSREAVRALLHECGATEASHAEAVHVPQLSAEQVAELHGLFKAADRRQCEPSLVGQLAESAVGIFFLALAKLARLKFAEPVPCPALVVIGLEAIGKSSFMRALTKCFFSPSGKGLTTRAPVRLCLVSIPQESAPSFEVEFRNKVHHLDLESEIAPKVMEIMTAEIPGSTLTEDEVKVTIHKPDIPDLVFIDLPGLRETDPSSKRLAIKYLQDPNNLVICLVEAHFNSLASHSGVSLVRDYGNVENTWLVLTRSDEVLTMGPEAIQDRLVSRSLGTSEDMSAIGFGSVHFVFSSSPRRPSDISLDDFEAEQYEQHIMNLPNISDADKELISQRCTMKRLMTSLVPWFETFLRKNGVPLALQWLKPKLQETLQSIEDLGRPVEELSIQEVMEAMLSCCDFQSVYNKLYREQDDSPGLAICLSPAQDMQLSLPKWTPAQQLQPPASAYWHQQTAVTAAALQGIREWLAAGHHLPLLQDVIRKAFASRGPPGFRLDRFQGLLEAILNGRLERCIDQQGVQGRILAVPAVAQLSCGLPNLSCPPDQPSMLAAIDTVVRTAFINLAVLPLERVDGPLVCCVKNIELEESARHQEDRQSAEDDLKAVQAAMQIMASIQAKEPANQDSPATLQEPPAMQEVQEPALHDSTMEEEPAGPSGTWQEEGPADAVGTEYSSNEEEPDHINVDGTSGMNVQHQPPHSAPASGVIDLSEDDQSDAGDPQLHTAGQTRIRGKRPLQSSDEIEQEPHPKKPATGTNTSSVASQTVRHGRQAIAESGRTNRGRIKQPASLKVQLKQIGKLRCAQGWFDAGCIFPDGYKAIVWYKSSKDLKSRVQHECSIFQAGGAEDDFPVFQIVAEDRPDEPLTASSCSGCWEKVLSRLNDARISRGHPTVKTNIPGPEYFGLNSVQVKAAFYHLDKDRRCNLYWTGEADRTEEFLRRQGQSDAHAAPATDPDTAGLGEASTDQGQASTVRRLFADGMEGEGRYSAVVA